LGLGFVVVVLVQVKRDTYYQTFWLEWAGLLFNGGCIIVPPDVLGVNDPLKCSVEAILDALYLPGKYYN